MIVRFKGFSENSPVVDHLTPGREYEVDKFDDGDYYVICDDGTIDVVYAHEVEVVEE